VQPAAWNGYYVPQGYAYPPSAYQAPGYYSGYQVAPASYPVYGSGYPYSGGQR
jgi:hypothetical protein